MRVLALSLFLQLTDSHEICFEIYVVETIPEL
jgi:hypothetical protein